MKVSGDDYAMFAQLSGDRMVREWVRAVLFKAVPSERTAEAHRTILGELLALRKILLNLQFTVAAGGPVTRDRMLAWIEEADADKGEGAGAAHDRRRRVGDGLRLVAPGVGAPVAQHATPLGRSLNRVTSS